MLLVIDNCEHLIDEVAKFCDELLSAGPEARLLATSREALDLDGEHTFRVGPLAMPEADSEFDEHVPAVELFVTRARNVRGDFALGSHNSTDVARVRRSLDGIPLAIELAAAQLGHMSVGELAERLGERFEVLTGGRRRERQHTMLAVMDWSWELLDPDEQRLLAWLAVFAGGWRLDSVESVRSREHLPPVIGTLRGLVAKSLIDVSEDQHGTSYRLLETVRGYASNQLRAREDADDADDAHRSHRDFYRRWVADAGLVKRFSSYEFLGQLNNDFANWRAAIEWSLDHEDQDSAIELLFAASLMASLQTRTIELIDRVDETLAESRPDASEWHVRRCQIAASTGRRHDYQHHADIAFDLAREQGDLLALAVAADKQAGGNGGSGDYESAMEWSERSHDYAQQAGNDQLRALSYERRSFYTIESRDEVSAQRLLGLGEPLSSGDGIDCWWPTLASGGLESLRRKPDGLEAAADAAAGFLTTHGLEEARWLHELRAWAAANRADLSSVAEHCQLLHQAVLRSGATLGYGDCLMSLAGDTLYWEILSVQPSFMPLLALCRS